METKNITIRIPVDMYDEMQQKSNDPRYNAGSINQQIVERLQKQTTLAKLSMNELRGTFTKEEWSALADILNSTMITPEFRYRPEFLIAEIDDTQALEQDLGAKWGIDISTLKDKCRKLTAAQLDALYTRVEEFWVNTDTHNLDAWSKF